MKLTKENASLIKVGDVVKFTYHDGTSRTGVVYATPADGSWGVICTDTDGNSFGHDASGDINFEILEEHDPVAKFGLRYDFVSNHN